MAIDSMKREENDAQLVREQDDQPKEAENHNWVNLLRKRGKVIKYSQ